MMMIEYVNHRTPYKDRHRSALHSPSCSALAFLSSRQTLARAPGLLEKVREGRAALDALAAKVRKGLKVAD